MESPRYEFTIRTEQAQTRLDRRRRIKHAAIMLALAAALLAPSPIATAIRVLAC